MASHWAGTRRHSHRRGTHLGPWFELCPQFQWSLGWCFQPQCAPDHQARPTKPSLCLPTTGSPASSLSATCEGCRDESPVSDWAVAVLPHPVLSLCCLNSRGLSPYECPVSSGLRRVGAGREEQ